MLRQNRHNIEKAKYYIEPSNEMYVLRKNQIYYVTL